MVADVAVRSMCGVTTMLDSGVACCWRSVTSDVPALDGIRIQGCFGKWGKVHLASRPPQSTEIRHKSLPRNSSIALSL